MQDDARPEAAVQNARRFVLPPGALTA
jgi:hypothetical protein